MSVRKLWCSFYIKNSVYYFILSASADFRVVKAGEVVDDWSAGVRIDTLALVGAGAAAPTKTPTRFFGP